VVDVEEESFERLPETLHSKIREVILGVHKLDKSLMHVLDTDRARQGPLKTRPLPPAHKGSIESS
jgi:hypothetical protein